RTQLSGSASFISLLDTVRQMTLSAYEHQDVPFEKVVEAVSTARDMSRTPLFQTLFSVQQVVSIGQEATVQ
ncbi:condensation domain-containing protein, partial [Chitinophaga sp. MD30]|uniref:condensation domain-containing protein n=2 Tax=Chitinophaga TaxID=79328 RepID=UPI0012FD08BF